MSVPLGVPDLQRLEKGIERGCGGKCWKLEKDRNGNSMYMCFIRLDNYCQDWLCGKIKAHTFSCVSQCPCSKGKDVEVMVRAVEMLRTGRTLD